MTPPTITIPQDRETEASVELIPGGGGTTIAMTYVYARSRDTRNANAMGQDFIAYRWDDKKIVFAICDGVSQSFYGEIAARFLGLRLVDALWQGQGKALADHLNRWTEDATREITDKVINPSLPEMQRVALERKREQGSESMFIAGVIEFTGKGKISLYYMGDMRVWLWDAKGQNIPIPDAKFETRERWSSKVGIKNGELHKTTIALDKVARMTAHSDGVGSFANRMNAVSQDLINSIVKEQYNAPASDDISIFDIDFHYPDIFGKVVTIPTPEFELAWMPGSTAVLWAHVWLATRYRISVDDGKSPYTDEIDAQIKVDPAIENVSWEVFGYEPKLAEGTSAVCRVQALNDYAYPSGWSEPFTVSANVVAHETLPAKPTEPGKKERKAQKKSRANAALTILVSVLLIVFLITAAWIALIVLNWNALNSPAS